MSQLAVGKDVLSLCSRCKLSLSHIIVVMASETKPDKVQCNTCKSTQKFKDPSKKAAVSKKAVSKSAKSKSFSKRALANAKPHGEVWLETTNAHAGPSVKYNTTALFSKGDLIDHPSFGLGVVEKLVDQNKIEVLFKIDSKMLGHNLK